MDLAVSLRLKVEEVSEAMKASLEATASHPHQGTPGKRALFLDRRRHRAFRWN
jgi:hypothetical protein